MKFKLSRGNALTGSEVEQWARWQREDPALASPFFHPKFTAIVGDAREDVFVGILEDGEAFFPFQRTEKGQGIPAGGTLSDYHGVIARKDFSWEGAKLIRNCGLKDWTFDHLPAAQSPFAQWRAFSSESPIIDLQSGAEIGSAKLRTDAANRRRKLQREVGTIEVQLGSRDESLLEQLFAWKSAQYLASGKTDLFAIEWARQVVRNVWAEKEEEFSGFLSVLKAGGKPVAMDLSIRSRGVLHSWFPAYDAALSVYSPGTILLLDIIAAAPGMRISTIDLGKGKAFYKQRLSNAVIPLAEGTVLASGWQASARLGALKAKEWVRHSPFFKTARELRQRAATLLRKPQP